MKVWAETEDHKEGVVHRFGHRRKTLELIDPYFSVLHFSFPVLPKEKCRTEKCGVAGKLERLILSVNERHQIVSHRFLFPVSQAVEFDQVSSGGNHPARDRQVHSVIGSISRPPSTPDLFAV